MKYLDFMGKIFLVKSKGGGNMRDELILGERIRAVRKKKGLTQTELGNAVGVEIKTIHRWEKGERTPRVEELKRLAKALNVDVNELLNGPAAKKIEINLIFGSMPEKGEIDMSENGNKFDLFMNKDGALGIRGAGNFKSLDDIMKFGADIVEELKRGFEFQQQRGALTGAGAN